MATLPNLTALAGTAMNTAADQVLLNDDSANTDKRATIDELLVGMGLGAKAPTAIGALELDVLRSVNTKSVSGDSTFTFGATPPDGSRFSMLLTEGGGANRVITIPSSHSIARGAAITSSTVQLDWYYRSSNTTYYLWGDPVTIGHLSADTTPAPTDLMEVYDAATNIHSKSTLAQVTGTAVKVTAASYTAGTTDPKELYGGVIYVTGAATITLPAVAVGASVTVITIGAVAVSVDPNAADLIYLDGTALSDGDKITNTSTAGDMAVLTYYDGTGWYAATDGWTDGN
jgi:hypothetical protein